MIRFGKLAVIQVALIAAAVVVVHGAPQPLEILRQSILSRTTVDFSGIRTVVVFQDGRKVHGVEQKIDCDAPKHLRIVVLAPETQRGTLCLTSGQHRWEYNPGTGRVIHAQLPSPTEVVQMRLEELERLAGRMKMQYVGSETIAGRRAHVIKVYTLKGLPVKKTWVDAQQHVELKTQRFDSHGQVKSSAYYTRIDFDPSFPPGLFEFSPPADAQVVEADPTAERMPLERAEQKAGFEALIPRYLPPGYRFHSDRTAVIEVEGKPTIWLSFSNGVETFSIFQRRSTGESREQICRTRSISWQEGNYCLTLMGTLAADEMQKVKDSIKP